MPLSGCFFLRSASHKNVQILRSKQNKKRFRLTFILSSKKCFTDESREKQRFLLPVTVQHSIFKTITAWKKFWRGDDEEEHKEEDESQGKSIGEGRKMVGGRGKRGRRV